MKKIQYILFAIAFLALVPVKNVQAQTETTYKNGLGYSKNISDPNDAGIYTITLEAFTTGNVSVTKKSLPADIVLVLDTSGSMQYDMNRDRGNSNERLNALKDAVEGFIDIINENDLYYVDEEGKPDKTKPREQRLGNRIAIVTYSTDAYDRTNGLMALGNSTTDNSGVTSLKTTVNGLTADGGTYAHKGMDLAYGILSPLNDTRQLRTTVFFTDGNPGLKGDWTSESIMWANDYPLDFIEGSYSYYGYDYDYASYRFDTFSTANATINTANNIKNLADDSKGIISNVYTVSIINNPGRQTQVYLGKTSSNYLGATNMGDWNGTWNNDTAMWNNGNGTRNTDGKNYAFASTSQEGLNDIFRTIAGSSGGSDADLGGSTVAVMDIVSANFMLPNGADPDQISVYTAPCTGGTEGALTFGTAIKAPGNTNKYHKIIKNPDGTIDWGPEELDIDDDIEVSIEGTNMIQVTGFDYASNFCGFENGVARGYKVLIEIPVKMDPNAVGGANSESNEPGSGIYADLDGDGTLDPIITYIPPKVDLPTNIYIEKEGLKKGESAKFRIERVDKNASEQIKSNPDAPEWEPVTTVFLTNTVGEGHKPMVKVRGLDPNYIYQIVEEPWSWAYTSEAITVTRTDLLITNPFKFKNTPKEGIDKAIRHAESKATNDFIGSGSATYVDSKDNGR